MERYGGIFKFRGSEEAFGVVGDGVGFFGDTDEVLVHFAVIIGVVVEGDGVIAFV